jgi:transposase InsO family protein
VCGAESTRPNDLWCADYMGEFGLPLASNSAFFGLSKLSVWWLRLGIAIERIKPGNPQQNGRHERTHLTLKKEATKPPALLLIGYDLGLLFARSSRRTRAERKYQGMTGGLKNVRRHFLRIHDHAAS